MWIQISESPDLTIFNISKSVHEGQPYEALRWRICHQHIQKGVQHDLLLDTNTHKHVLNKAYELLRDVNEDRTSSSYLLREARPHWVLRVAKRRALEHGRGEFQHLPQKLIKLCKHHDSTRVGDLRENIWEKANVRLIIPNRNTVQNRLLTFPVNVLIHSLYTQQYMQIICACMFQQCPCVFNVSNYKRKSCAGSHDSQISERHDVQGACKCTYSVVCPLFSLHTLLTAWLSLRKQLASRGFHCK